MEIYLKWKKEQIIKNNLITEQKVLSLKQRFENALQNLQEISKEEIDQKLIFCINSALIFGLFKSAVKDDIFEKILVSTDLKEKLIELESIISVIDSLNEHTVFYFKKQIILESFCNYSLCYLMGKFVNEFNLENFQKNKEIKGFYNDLYRSLKKVKRQLVEDVKSPRKEDGRLLLEEYRLHKQKHIETTKTSPVPLKTFEYVLGKYFFHPHRLAYQPLVYYIKELNEDLLQEAFNEKEFYVALYDLLKAISYDKEHYNDDNNGLIYISFNSDVKEYKSKTVRNWFS